MSRTCKRVHLLTMGGLSFSYSPNQYGLFVANDIVGHVVEWRLRYFNDGVYIMYEKGEIGYHENPPKIGGRIVFIGYNSKDDNLMQELEEHYTGTIHQSRLRNHIGSCFLNPKNPNYRPEYTTNVNLLEQKISEYIQNNITFSLLKVADKVERKDFAKKLIATVAQCEECMPSPNWLGKYCLEPKISNGKLWNVEGLNFDPLEDNNYTWAGFPQRVASATF